MKSYFSVNLLTSPIELISNFMKALRYYLFFYKNRSTMSQYNKIKSTESVRTFSSCVRTKPYFNLLCCFEQFQQLHCTILVKDYQVKCKLFYRYDKKLVYPHLKQYSSKTKIQPFTNSNRFPQIYHYFIEILIGNATI